MIANNNSGQALLEYIIILVFVATIGSTTLGYIFNYINGSIGNLNHILSQNLNVGVCSRNCFFEAYKNGYRP